MEVEPGQWGEWVGDSYLNGRGERSSGHTLRVKVHIASLPALGNVGRSA